VSEVVHLGFEGGEAHLRLDHVMSQLRSVEEDKSYNSRFRDTQYRYIDYKQTPSDLFPIPVVSMRAPEAKCM